MRPYELLDTASYQRFLAALRDDRCVEYGLVGWPAIGAWFVKVGFTKRPPNVDTLRRWRARWFMPVTRARVDTAGPRRVPWVTNLQLHAWLATQGQAMLLPRWHPAHGTRGNVRPMGRPVTLVDGKPKPSTLRMRKTLARRRVQRIAVERSAQRVEAAALVDAARSLSTGTAPKGRTPRGYEGGSGGTP